MSGFPTRVLRSFFGPILRNIHPVKDPNTTVGAESLNPLFWQVAGMNLVIARAAVEASWDGSQFVVESQFEAWNAENDQAKPVLARASAGVYTYTFLGSYLDDKGTAVATVLGQPVVQSNKVLTAYADRVNAYAWKVGLVIHVRLWDATGTAVDTPFTLAVR